MTATTTEPVVTEQKLDRLRALATTLTEDLGLKGTWQWFGDYRSPYLATRGHGRLFILRADQAHEHRRISSDMDESWPVDREGCDGAYCSLPNPDGVEPGGVYQINHPIPGFVVREAGQSGRAWNVMRTADEIPVFEVCREATAPDDHRVYRTDVVGFRSPAAEVVRRVRRRDRPHAARRGHPAPRRAHRGGGPVSTMTAQTTDRRFEVSFRTERTFDCRVDLVKFLQTMTEQQREHYRRTDLSEFGYDDESERPLAYLCGYLDDRADGGIWQSDEARGIVTAFDDVETELNTQKGYSADDLFAAVPWLAPEVAMDPEALARIPGPHDVPLFDLPGVTR